jgi:hypothetical protein
MNPRSTIKKSTNFPRPSRIFGKKIKKKISTPEL